MRSQFKDEHPFGMFLFYFAYRGGYALTYTTWRRIITNNYFFYIEKRQAEAARIAQRFKDRVPVICEKVENSDIPEIDKRKYLVPVDLTVGQFVYVIRKRIKLPSEKAIFIFVNDILPPTAALISTIYEEHKDEDGFLYVLYSGENTFGEEVSIDFSALDFSDIPDDI